MQKKIYLLSGLLVLSIGLQCSPCFNLLQSFRYFRALHLWKQASKNSFVNSQFKSDVEFLDWVGKNPKGFIWPHTEALRNLDSSGKKIVQARLLLDKALNSVDDIKLEKQIGILQRRTRIDLRSIFNKKHVIENSPKAIDEKILRRDAWEIVNRKGSQRVFV